MWKKNNALIWGNLIQEKAGVKLSFCLPAGHDPQEQARKGTHWWKSGRGKGRTQAGCLTRPSSWPPAAAPWYQGHWLLETNMLLALSVWELAAAPP